MLLSSRSLFAFTVWPDSMACLYGSVKFTMPPCIVAKRKTTMETNMERVEGRLHE